MAKLSAEAKVGLLVIVGSIALLCHDLCRGQIRVRRDKRAIRSAALFDSVAGLDEKSAVRMAGVKIGTVERVELSDSRAKVIMRINPEVQIKRGSEATIKTMGLLGDKFVEIIPAGTAERTLPKAAAQQRKPGFLQPEETIQVTVSPSDVDKLDQPAERLSQTISSR